MELKRKKCIGCEKGNVKVLDKNEAQDFLDEVLGWSMNKGATEISKEFIFKDFVQAVDFVNAVADIAEGEGHHPNIKIVYNKVRLDLSTHAVEGLTENDFIVASKIDSLPIIFN